MRCATWYHLYNLKNVKNTHGGVLVLVTKSNTPPRVFFTFLRLYKQYQIAQNITLSVRFTMTKVLTLVSLVTLSYPFHTHITLFANSSQQKQRVTYLPHPFRSIFRIRKAGPNRSWIFLLYPCCGKEGVQYQQKI